MFIEGNMVYYSNAIENKIYFFTLSGELNQILLNDNSNFTMIKKDLPTEKDEVIQWMKKKKDDFSIILNIYNLNKNIILVNYIKNKRSQIELVNKKESSPKCCVLCSSSGLSSDEA